MKWTFLLCMALLIVSCNSLLKSRPAGLLDESQMTDVLVDMHLTESTVRAANDSISRLNDTTDLRTRFAEVFRKNDVSPHDFNTSLKYYLENIDELDKIYTEVIARLTGLEASMQQVADKQKHRMMNRNNTAADSVVNRNPWYRTLYKIPPGQIQYLDPLVFRNK